MKPSILLAALALFALPAHGDQATESYKAGMTAMTSGNYQAAQTAFMKTLKLRPDHANARYQLGQLKANKGKIIATKRSSQLAAIKIPKIDLNNVTLSEALVAISGMVDEQVAKAKPKSDFSPNFIIRDPKNKLGEREVSLRLKNVPAKVALDYVLEQAGGIARYDEHATVIKPAPQSASR